MDVYQRRRLVALSAIAVVFIVFVLLIRSCGGDDEETPAPLAGATGASGAAGVTVLAQADYIAEADTVCLQANTSFADLDESDPVQSDNDKAEILAGEVQQLQSLPPPDDGTDQLDKFLSVLEKWSAAYADRATATERGDTASVAELDATIDESVTKAEKAAAAFGFEVCGNLDEVGESTGGGGGGGGGDESAEAPTDTGGTATPVEPVAPTTTTPVPVAPAPTEGGGTATPAPAPAPDDGGGDSSSGGVSP